MSTSAVFPQSTQWIVASSLLSSDETIVTCREKQWGHLTWFTAFLPALACQCCNGKSQTVLRFVVYSTPAQRKTKAIDSLTVTDT